MFYSDFFENYNYLPILALSPAEMKAIEELPSKDKDLILPLFPLKGWSSSKLLENSIKRIEKAIGDRKWVADIDRSFLYSNRKFELTGEYPREVHSEIHSLLDPKEGYNNWYAFLAELPSAVPVVQLGDLSQLDYQIERLDSLDRGLVFRLIMEDIGSFELDYIVSCLKKHRKIDVLVMLDFGDINREMLTRVEKICQTLRLFEISESERLFSISSSSFPFSFSHSHRGELPIYERQLYRGVEQICANLRLVYSDRGSARAGKMTGGTGTPPPRIDYPLKNDWRYIRKEFDDSRNIKDGEKNRLYEEIAKEIMASDYWIKGLYLWGTQMIELTEIGDNFGITSAIKATSARINIHLYQQLHYDTDIVGILDTDEEWVD